MRNAQQIRFNEARSCLTLGGVAARGTAHSCSGCLRRIGRIEGERERDEALFTPPSERQAMTRTAVVLLGTPPIAMRSCSRPSRSGFSGKRVSRSRTQQRRSGTCGPEKHLAFTGRRPTGFNCRFQRCVVNGTGLKVAEKADAPTRGAGVAPSVGFWFACVVHRAVASTMLGLQKARGSDGDTPPHTRWSRDARLHSSTVVGVIMLDFCSTRILPPAVGHLMWGGKK